MKSTETYLTFNFYFWGYLGLVKAEIEARGPLEAVSIFARDFGGEVPESVTLGRVKPSYWDRLSDPIPL